MITNKKLKRIDKEGIDFVGDMLKKKFLNSKLPVAENCMYLDSSGKRFCKATSHESCERCRFFSPTLKEKIEVLKNI